MTDDQQRTAEGLDPDELGDVPTQTLAYPPDEPLGAEDPTQDDRVVDSVASRSEREEPDFGEAGGDLSDGESLRLIVPNDMLADDVAESVAAGVPQDDDDLSAEEAAIHTID